MDRHLAGKENRTHGLSPFVHMVKRPATPEKKRAGTHRWAEIKRALVPKAPNEMLRFYADTSRNFGRLGDMLTRPYIRVIRSGWYIC